MNQRQKKQRKGGKGPHGHQLSNGKKGGTSATQTTELKRKQETSMSGGWRDAKVNGTWSLFSAGDLEEWSKQPHAKGRKGPEILNGMEPSPVCHE